jgi:hypothetical protein
MNSGVATRAEASALLQERRVIEAADKHLTRRVGQGDLCVTFQAQIVVALGQHLRVDGTVHVMARRAAFAHGFVLEHVWSRLFAMALRAILVHATDLHLLRLENVFAMRIVAGRATHPTFLDRMMELQAELGVLVEVTLETRFGTLAGIDDQLAVAAGIHV